MWRLFKKTRRKSDEMELKNNNFKYVPDSVFPNREVQDRVEEYLNKKREEEVISNKGDN